MLAYADIPTLQREDIDAVLGASGEHIGVPDLRLGSQGMTALTVEDELEIALIHLPRLAGLVLMSRFSWILGQESGNVDR